MDPVEAALNVCILVYLIGLIYGFFSKRLYFAKWYYYHENKKKYWEVFFSYILMIVGLFALRHFLLSKIAVLS